MMSSSANDFATACNRRDFMSWVKNGLGSAAAAGLLLKDRTLSAAPVPGECPDPCPHFKPKAKRAIHICLCGAMSQVDSFDFKTELLKHHGQSLQSTEKPDVFFGQVGLLRKPDWEFKRRDKNGLWVSDLFPHRRSCGRADDHSLDVRGNVEPYTRHVPTKHRFSSQRFSCPRIVAFLWPWQ